MPDESNTNEVKVRGRKPSGQPSLLKFQAALRGGEALPEWITVEEGSIDPVTRLRKPTLYVTPVTLRLTDDGQKVEAVRFTAEEHRAAQTEIVASVDAVKFIAWATKSK